MYAQDIPLFSGIQFNQTVEAVQTSVASRAGHIALKEVERPVFPMAEKSEAHLVALQYETGSHTLEEVVLTFADDQLVLIQAKGNVVDTFLGKWKPDLGRATEYGMDFNGKGRRGKASCKTGPPIWRPGL
jgi:hypothetical protein